MIIVLAIIAGALFGWRRAAARGGDRLDQWQWAAVYGIIFALAALALTIFAARLGLL